MKYWFTFFILLLVTITAFAQNVTGIWRGNFVQNSFGFGEDKYRFEVQVAEKPNHALQAVTYSYKTTVFYGKAEATGIFTAKSKNFLLKELKLVDLKITEPQSGACLMTCYLDYNKMGSLETLTGNYTSISIKDKSDCGSGRVYLERATTSDFYKEEFVTKREKELKKKTQAPPVAKKTPPTPPKPLAPKKVIVKPGAEDNLVSRKKNPTPETAHEPKKDEPVKVAPPVVKTFPKPEIMRTRSNDLQKTLYTSAKEFKIELYDNGEIDGDRISVYHNNELIVSNKQLTNKPITFTIKADENTSVHEFVMVADNLGTIPPNTALMIVTAGDQRHEVFVTSTEQKNAVVRVEYKAE